MVKFILIKHNNDLNTSIVYSVPGLSVISLNPSPKSSEMSFKEPRFQVRKWKCTDVRPRVPELHGVDWRCRSNGNS